MPILAYCHNLTIRTRILALSESHQAAMKWSGGGGGASKTFGD